MMIMVVVVVVVLVMMMMMMMTMVVLNTLGTRCLRHCATNPKVAGSIPDGVIVIFH